MIGLALLKWGRPNRLTNKTILEVEEISKPEY